MGGQRKQIVAGGDGFQDGTIVNADISASAAIDASKISGVQASDATLTSIAALGTAADKTLYTTGIDTWAETALSSFGRSLIDDAAASNARTTLGLVIGTDVQAQDATLTSLAALGTAADKMAYTTGIDTWAETAITAAGRAILDDADATAQRATLGLVIGTDVQAYDAQLADVAGLAVTDGNFIVGNGANFVAESGATARTSLGLGTGDTPSFTSVLLNNANGVQILDSDASHNLSITTGSNLTASRTLTINPGDAARTVTLSGDTTLSGTNSGDQTITLTGDVTGSGTGSFAATIANDAVTYAKMQDVSATDMLLGRSTAGAGIVEEIACTAAGRAILDDADASAQRTTLGLGTIATQASSSVSITGGSVTGITDLAIADGGTGASTAANARTNLGLVIGTDVQAYDAQLADVAGLAVTDNNFIVGNGTNFVAESGATARTSMGVGTGDTPSFTSVILNNANGVQIKDSDASHNLSITTGSNLTAARTLTINPGDAARTVTLSGDTTLSGTNTGDQTITLTGNVTGSGTGSFAATIANDAVTYAKMQNISATDMVLGRSTAGSGDVEEIPCTAAGRALLSIQKGFCVRHELGSDYSATHTASGTGAIAAATATLFTGEGVFGVMEHNTGTTTTGRGGTAMLGNLSQDNAFGEGVHVLEGYIKIPTLSDGTDTYIIKFGHGTTQTSASDTEAIRFIYDSTSSANWRYSCISASSETISTSSVAVSGNTWIFLQLVINSGATSVEFFVDGTSLGTITTNIPINVATKPVFGIYKSAGTTARILYTDYISFYNTFTTARS